MLEPPQQQALLTREELKRQERDAIVAALKQTNGKISGSRRRGRIARHEADDILFAHRGLGFESRNARTSKLSSRRVDDHRHFPLGLHNFYLGKRRGSGSEEGTRSANLDCI